MGSCTVPVGTLKMGAGKRVLEILTIGGLQGLPGDCVVTEGQSTEEESTNQHQHVTLTEKENSKWQQHYSS